MQSGFFWKNWSSPYKEIYSFLFALLIISILTFAYYAVLGPEGIIGWSYLVETKPVQIIMEKFAIGPFTLQTDADSKVFLQSFVGNFPETQMWSYYTFLIITSACLILLFTIATTLSRFWYLVATSLFVIVLVNFKFELLMLFGSDSKVGLIIALVLFLPVSFYFNSVRQNTTFLVRLLTFIAIGISFSLLIFFFAEVPVPFFHLATYGVINPLVISLIFILMIAHEIIAAFINLLTRSSATPGKNNLSHFLIITLIYLANLLLAYLKESNVIGWNLVYINLFILLGISTMLGIWSYSQRESQYSYLFQFRPLGAFFYIAMAICCFSTLAHFSITTNDPAIEVFRDFIIYGHLGYGLIFTIYIISNFIELLKNGVPVYRVLYKPQTMPYFTFRFAGIIAFAAFVLKSNWTVPFNQSLSAYYNSLGDLHRYVGDDLLSENYYEQGAVFGFNNHKSNYALATLAHSNKKATKAEEYYLAASKKNPTPQNFINLANIYSDQDKFFEAIFALQDGRTVFPENGEILNNLGVLYSQTNILDSAAIFFDESVSEGESTGTASANILSLLAINDLPVHPDSIIAEYEIEKDLISKNNIKVLYNKLRLASENNFIPQDSILSFLEAATLYNQGINHLFEDDSNDFNYLGALAEVSDNINFENELNFAFAVNLEKAKNVSNAFRKVTYLANSEISKSGYYFNLLGLWAMKYGAYNLAIEKFKIAKGRNYEEASRNLAIAQTEALKMNEAIASWKELIKTEEFSQVAKGMLDILSKERSELTNELDIYYYLRYKTTFRDTTTFNELVKKIEDSNYKAQAYFDISHKLWRMDYVDEAINYYSKLSGISITDGDLFEKLKWYELKILASQGNIRGLAKKINQGVEFSKDRMIEKLHYKGLIAQASGDSTEAVTNFKSIAYKNPFYPGSIISAADYINQTDKFEAYNILLNAIEINPNSVKLQKAYIMQCARIENETYAAISLEKVEELLPEKDFLIFRNQYLQLLLQVKEEAENY